MDSDMLVSAILRTMAGDSVVSPEMTNKLVTAIQASQVAPVCGAPSTSVDLIHGLSSRECEILDHAAKGASNKEVARAPGIAETTVKIHVQHILRKLNLSSRVQAPAYLAERSR